MKTDVLFIQGHWRDRRNIGKWKSAADKKGWHGVWCGAETADKKDCQLHHEPFCDGQAQGAPQVDREAECQEEAGQLDRLQQDQEDLMVLGDPAAHRSGKRLGAPTGRACAAVWAAVEFTARCWSWHVNRESSAVFPIFPSWNSWLGRAEVAWARLYKGPQYSFAQGYRSPVDKEVLPK